MNDLRHEPNQFCEGRWCDCITFSPVAEPKCERCGRELIKESDLDVGGDNAPFDRLDVGNCRNCPPTTEPEESVGKADLIAAVDNFIAVNAEMWQGQDPDEYMNEIRERPTAPPAESVEDRARAFYKQSQSVWVHELMASFAQAEIERQTPAIEKAAREEGIRFACAVVDEMYGRCNTHKFMQGDCVLAKLNMLDKSKLRPNPVDHEAAIIERFKQESGFNAIKFNGETAEQILREEGIYVADDGVTVNTQVETLVKALEKIGQCGAGHVCCNVNFHIAQNAIQTVKARRSGGEGK